MFGVVCIAKDDVGEEVREAAVVSMLALAREIDEVIGVKDVRLRGITCIVSDSAPHPYCVRVDP